MKQFELEDIRGFHTMPEDQGQIVEVSYGVDTEWLFLIRKTHDRSDRSTTYSYAPIDEENPGTFEPQNGRLPRIDGEWKTCDVSDYRPMFRVFCGRFTKQVNHNGEPADPSKFYWEPSDYVGDVLYSAPFETFGDAMKEAEEES